MKDGKNTPGKVAIFSTCYVNYNEPGIGHDLLAILEHNEVPYVVVLVTYTSQRPEVPATVGGP